MLTCIACTKQISGSLRQSDQDSDDFPTANPRDTIRGLTSQIKDMAVKASGTYRQCKPGADTERIRGSYRRAGLDGESSPALTETVETAVVAEEEEEEEREWVAQVEPGVLITFASLPHGGNDLKRIRFSRETFNRWQAQRWWAENYEKIAELYNIRRFSREGVPLLTPPRPESEKSKPESAEESKGGAKRGQLPAPAETRTSGEVNSPRTSSSDETTASVSNAGDLEREWVEEDDLGVFITIRSLPGGRRELRRVRFSRERFSESHARLWWEQNRARVHQQYL